MSELLQAWITVHLRAKSGKGSEKTSAICLQNFSHNISQILCSERKLLVIVLV